MPKATDIQAVIHDEVVFVDQGENFEELRCPSCKTQLAIDWWQEAFEAAGEAGFIDLAVRVPCCRSKMSLNELDYRWPAGFARFVLEASEPELSGPLDAPSITELEAALGHPVRQISTRY